MEEDTKNLWIVVSQFKVMLDSCNEEVRKIYKNLPDSAIEADCMLLDFARQITEEVFPKYLYEKQQQIAGKTIETILQSMTSEQNRKFLMQLALQHEKTNTWLSVLNTPLSRVLFEVILKNVEREMQNKDNI
jgi:hypothetical protein